MPRYFFHDVGDSRSRDGEGVDLPNIHAARQEAMGFAGETLRSAPERVWSSGQWRVEVEDDQGRLLFTIVTVAVDAPEIEHMVREGRRPRSRSDRENGG